VTKPVKGLKAATSSIPIVFTNVTDPVGSGFVETLSRPGGNITGFTDMDPAIAGKWVELLKEVAPHIKHAAMMFNPETAPFAKPYFRAFEDAGQQYGLPTRYATVESKEQYPTIIEGCSQPPLTGLVVIDDGLFNRNKELVIRLAAEHRVPAIYNHAAYVTAGGLISYGIDIMALYRQSVSYIHRILSGEKPSDLPVQLPTKYLMTVNTKAADALGIKLSANILAQADYLVER
jgi:putative ABC transport system substrate-binding protein